MSIFLLFLFLFIFILASPGQRLFITIILAEAVLVGFYPPAFWILFLSTVIISLLLSHAKSQWRSSRPNIRLPRHPANTHPRTNPRLQNASRRHVAP